MSVIVAKKYKTYINLVGDSCLTYNLRMKKNLPDIKVAEIDGIKSVIGVVGPAFWLSLYTLYVSDNVPVLKDLDSIKKHFYSFYKYVIKIDNTYANDSFTAIFACPLGLYEIADHFVIEIKDYTAIGCGALYALGALEANVTPYQSIEIACKLDPFCGGDIVTKRVELKK